MCLGQSWGSLNHAILRQRPGNSSWRRFLYFPSRSPSCSTGNCRKGRCLWRNPSVLVAAVWVCVVLLLLLWCKELQGGIARQSWSRVILLEIPKCSSAPVCSSRVAELCQRSRGSSLSKWWGKCVSQRPGEALYTGSLCSLWGGEQTPERTGLRFEAR